LFLKHVRLFLDEQSWAVSISGLVHMGSTVVVGVQDTYRS